ncbi:MULTISPECIES: glycoside hydrolase family 3 protein [Megamonas]|uniref:glycoside hydrolase family 3 protein n=1 Tax=Megamonas TaxID=158846 RepID=UPI000E4149DB|nr:MULTISPECIES: glycoside hydrolase family 3 N-terminal domain-containing protein [Megamonas]RGO05156.1 glycoside hydrolase family 3 protein [Megamonas rupellensis]
MRKQKIIGIVIIIVIVLAILGINNRNIFNDDEQVIQDKQQIKQENLTIDEKVDKTVESMSQTEKLGQMVMIGIQGTKVDDDSLYMLNQYHMGGVILFDRNMENPEQVKQLTSDLQAQSNEKVPLFIGIDEEGGDVVRMAEKLTPPPSQKEIGATGDIEQAKTWAIKTAKSLKDMGINVNFAPVADVGSNDKRSYSTDTNTVIDFVRAATKGYQQENIIYSLKHFPGIGKGRVDSHVDSSSIDVAKEVLMTEDIIPFKTIIDENDPNDYFILVSHLKYPALDEEYPASLSSKIMTDLLRNELGYKGIIITDDMEMGAVANHNEFRSIGVKAVKAGADIVLVCHEYEHQQEVYLGLLDAVNSGEISQERIDESVKRIIKVKLLHLYQ